MSLSPIYNFGAAAPIKSSPVEASIIFSPFIIKERLNVEVQVQAGEYPRAGDITLIVILLNGYVRLPDLREGFVVHIMVHMVLVVVRKGW